LQTEVLISGSGTNLQALIDAVGSPALPNAQITLVLSNRKAVAYGLEGAAQCVPSSIPAAYFALKPYLNKNPGATMMLKSLNLFCASNQIS
jgi:phosphoribosylglycinamide formyltransferase